MLRLLIALSLGTTLSAQALTFQTRMENVVWTVEGDQFECRLSQKVEGYGEAVFVRKAGEHPVFELTASNNLMRPGPARLFNNPPPWRPGSVAAGLGQGMIESGATALRLPYQQTLQMLDGLAQGLHPTIERSAHSDALQAVRVVVSNIGYRQAWSEYEQCIVGLLPMSREQLARTPVGFPSGGVSLDAGAQQLLDTVLVYLAADPAITAIELDGHSDNVGDRLANRELSRQRALAVQSYLQSRGVDEQLFKLRFHGERYPVAKNNTAAGRAANRRVSLRLIN